MESEEVNLDKINNLDTGYYSYKDLNKDSKEMISLNSTVTENMDIENEISNIHFSDNTINNLSVSTKNNINMEIDATKFNSSIISTQKSALEDNNIINLAVNEDVNMEKNVDCVDTPNLSIDNASMTNNNISDLPIIDIASSIDAGWQQRSTGRSFSSLSGK